MPFKSPKQRAWMHANKKQLAKEWEQEYPPQKPQNLRPPKRRK